MGTVEGTKHKPTWQSCDHNQNHLVPAHGVRGDVEGRLCREILGSLGRVDLEDVLRALGVAVSEGLGAVHQLQDLKEFALHGLTHRRRTWPLV